MRPSYGVFGKQCMQCVIPGSLIVAGDVTVFRPKGIAFRTLVFCLVEFHVSQIRPGGEKCNECHWHTNSQEAWNVGGFLMQKTHYQPGCVHCKSPWVF
jgi:hypothetical protein